MTISRVYASNALRARPGFSPDGRKTKKKRKQSALTRWKLKIAARAMAAKPADPLPAPLPVPVPAERVRAPTPGVSRPGQAEFRGAIIAAYRMCAVTRCEVEAVLEAAHIIPYVDERSNIISNGLCLRSDIHALYDRNLILIGADGVVLVSNGITCPEYRAMHGRSIERPVRDEDQPDVRLLAVRHMFIKG